MLRVGLTGGIACGKTYVRRRMQDAGLATLDLDVVAHEVTAPGGSAYDAVIAAFGRDIVGSDGQIHRPTLGALVFADPAARARLNAIVHPRVREEEDRRAAQAAGRGAALLVTDAALLVEAGFHLRFDRLVVVHCTPDEQLRRLRLRDGLDEAAARARLRAQMPIAEKRTYAHFEVATDGTFAQTDTAVDAVTAALQDAAQAVRARPIVGRAPARAAIGFGPQVGPRGLTPGAVLADVAAAGALDLDRIARLLEPPAPAGEPWYRAAMRSGSHGPEALAAPVALWSLARAGGDPEYVAAAAASLARLTHADPSAVAGACLTALLLAEALAPSGAWLSEARWLELSRRWAGAAPSDAVRRSAREWSSRVQRETSPPGAVTDALDRSLDALGFA